MANYDWIIAKYATQYPNVDPEFVKAIIQNESGGDPDATNLAAKKVGGAHGIAQLTPATAHSLGVSPYDPEQSIWATYRLVDQSLASNNGDYAKAAAEFYGGADKRQHGPKTRAYVKKVIQTWQAGRQSESAPETPNLDRLAFGKAFAQARASGVDEFAWRGKRYTTQTAEEAAKPARPAPRRPREVEGTIRIADKAKPPDVAADPLDNMPIVRSAGGRLATGRVRGALEPPIGMMDRPLEPVTPLAVPPAPPAVLGQLSQGHQALMNAIRTAYNAMAPIRDYPLMQKLGELNQDYTDRKSVV